MCVFPNCTVYKYETFFLMILYECHLKNLTKKLPPPPMSAKKMQKSNKTKN